MIPTRHPSKHPDAFIPGGDCEARADCQCGELVDRIASSSPIRKLFFVEALDAFLDWYQAGRRRVTPRE